MLEARRLSSPDADLLWKDLNVVRSSPVRLLHMFYERVDFSPASHSGRHLLHGLLETLPDNKVVEDIHNNIRRCAKAQPNPVLGLCHIQDLIVSSDVMKSRDIPHPAELTKEVWCRNFKKTTGRYKRKSHHAWKHKLKERWTAIMASNKTWHTMSEDTLRRTAAAWHWLHVGASATHSLAAGLFSKLLILGTIVQKGRGTEFFISLGHAAWPAKRVSSL